VSDIFHEVDEEVRREQLKKLWERYQYYIVAAVVVILVGISAWRGYEWWEAKRAGETGTAFEAAVTLSEAGKRTEAAEAFGKIAAEGASGYRALARMREAAELAQQDTKAGIAAYEKVASDRTVGPVLQDLAALRSGQLMVDNAPYEEVRQRLEPLAETGRPFRHNARELLALSAWRSGDTAAAKRWTDMIVADAETPASLRGRVEMLVALMAADKQS
jgi:hypothetical protein